MCRNKSSLFAVLALALLTAAQTVWAQNQNQRQLPIYIESDSATLDDQTGLAVYRGNVVITQGDTVITGDTVKVFAPQRQIEWMTSEGQPATLLTLDEEGQETRANAEHMEYRLQEELAILTRHAVVWQGEDEIRGDRIEYFLNTEQMQVYGGPTGRFQGVFKPREEAEAAP
ncbi:lipopolysaccharide export system protein LptA [Ectothiorhodosinus mongolicus]|uniref:Lipopolysaccharide export system protein LptA n=1 Tax=Ectothiorhodosinus mongolicus TaxID=233100 RepID=A0A1R3VUL0_9GAMM|nr:lipopolysaccharide transport periplasmic protein LptA [Ectothiorhodosinus mongolicus]ULX56712.1 lipopolysaccharide transport periplasmic protein LptA [Ectothiorhodosinus mongolicus]SIT66959.1 lipopolysaccharide export system protein LptA [Ectothiorhodosinus mongolicus]